MTARRAVPGTDVSVSAARSGALLMASCSIASSSAAMPPIAAGSAASITAAE